MPDRAAPPVAPATELDEPTPEMIAAGLDVLWASGSLESPAEALDRALVAKIYDAMRLSAR